MPKKSISELIRARWIAMSKVDSILSDLDAVKDEVRDLDRQITARLEKVADALDMDSTGELDAPEESGSRQVGHPVVGGPVIPNQSTFAPANRVTIIRRPHGEPGSRTSKYDDDIAAVLSRANRPMKTKEILDELQRRGTKISGKVPVNNLAAHLSHSEKFTRTERGWALKQGELGAH